MTIATYEAGAALAERLDTLTDIDFGFLTHSGSGLLSTTIHVHEIPELITFSMVNPELHQHAFCFLGSSAIGKTYAIREGFYEGCSRLMREPSLHELHVSQMGPTDIMGVPRDDGQGRTVWYPPRVFPLQSVNPSHEADYREASFNYLNGHSEWYEYVNEMRPHVQYGLFFDEVTNPSNPSILHQCFSIWHGKFVADHKLLSDTVIVLAGNRVEDCTNSIPLAASATSRLDLIEVVPSLAGWLKAWATKPRDQHRTNAHPLVVSFLMRNSVLFAPGAASLPAMQPYPAPRNWSYVSDLLYANEDRLSPLPDHVLFATVAGRIGDNAARGLWAFRDNYYRLPDAYLLLHSDAVPGSPYGWLPNEWPRELDLLHTLGYQMVQQVTPDTSERFMRFMLDHQKFPPEIAVAAMMLLSTVGKREMILDGQAELAREFAIKYQSFLFHA